MPRPCGVVLHVRSYKGQAILVQMPRACRVETHVWRVSFRP